MYATQIHDIAHSHSPHNAPHSPSITKANLIKCVAFTDVHNTMLNATTRLAISINNFPPFEFDWSDNRPQKSRHTLTLSELLPNAEDGQQLYDRAVAYTMKLLVESFPSLEKLKPLISTGKSLTSSLWSFYSKMRNILMITYRYCNNILKAAIFLVMHRYVTFNYTVIIGAYWLPLKSFLGICWRPMQDYQRGKTVDGRRVNPYKKTAMGTQGARCIIIWQR